MAPNILHKRMSTVLSAYFSLFAGFRFSTVLLWNTWKRMVLGSRLDLNRLKYFTLKFASIGCNALLCNIAVGLVALSISFMISGGIHKISVPSEPCGVSRFVRFLCARKFLLFPPGLGCAAS